MDDSIKTSIGAPPRTLANDTSSHQECPANLKSEVLTFASRNYIDINETFHTGIANPQVAIAQYRDARKAFPEVPGYRMRNVLPLAAFRWMIVGALIAIPCTVAAELIACCLSAVVIACSAWFLKNYRGGATAVALILGVIGFLGPFIAGGWVWAWVITTLGRRRKNRNRWVAAGLAATAAASAVLILWFLYLQLAREPFQKWDPFRLGANLDVFTNAFFGIVFILTGVSGACFAVSMIKSQRFCEECQEYMNLIGSPQLRAGVIKTMVSAIAQDSLTLAAGLLSEQSGEDGAAAFSRCPNCGRGLLEITVSIEAVNKKWETYRATWSVLMRQLSKEEMDIFRPLLSLLPATGS